MTPPSFGPAPHLTCSVYKGRQRTSMSLSISYKTHLHYLQPTPLLHNTIRKMFGSRRSPRTTTTTTTRTSRPSIFHRKNPNRQAAGYKGTCIVISSRSLGVFTPSLAAALHNPNTTSAGRTRAKAELRAMASHSSSFTYGVSLTCYDDLSGKRQRCTCSSQHPYQASRRRSKPSSPPCHYHYSYFAYHQALLDLSAHFIPTSQFRSYITL